MPLAIQANDVRAAAERIRPLARHTPVLRSADFDAESRTRVFFKCENLQVGGAFKIRGAANLILSLPEAELGRGVVAYSSGNHAQATAIAARHVGTEATIVMPEDAPRSKTEATRAYGARIVTYDRFHDSREQIASQIQKETGATLVPGTRLVSSPESIKDVCKIWFRNSDACIRHRDNRKAVVGFKFDAYEAAFHRALHRVVDQN